MSTYNAHHAYGYDLAIGPPSTVRRAGTFHAPDTPQRPRLRSRPPEPEPYDVLGSLIDYESGDLDLEQTLTLFAELVRSGLAYSLQGHYGRTAHAFIEQGLISPDGYVL